MELQIHPFELGLRYPFAISRHTYHSVHTLIVELRYNHISGFGEATLNPYYGITMENLMAAFSGITGMLSEYDFNTPAILWEDLHNMLDENYFALSAIDCAAHDLYCKLKVTPFSNLYGMNYDKYPFTSYTLGIGTIEDLKRKISELPWPVYKLKLGASNDKEIVCEILNHTESLLRIDANGGWNLKDATEMAEILAGAGVELIEQPLPRDQWDEMYQLHEICSLPLIADESCIREKDLDRCRRYFDGINIKLSKCGGLTPALRMISKARNMGMKVMIGCMTESSVGISAAAQLLPLVDYADLDGPLLLKEDVATGISYRKGSVLLEKLNGLGFKFRYGKFEANPVLT